MIENEELRSERLDGEFEIDVGRGTMICGYCNQFESWPHALLGYTQLTGFHMLGIELATNTLVVLVEATTLAGAHTCLPHHCLHIPEEKHREFAPTAVLAREEASHDDRRGSPEGGAAVGCTDA
jgi:hypothetical protein